MGECLLKRKRLTQPPGIGTWLVNNTLAFVTPNPIDIDCVFTSDGHPGYEFLSFSMYDYGSQVGAAYIYYDTEEESNIGIDVYWDDEGGWLDDDDRTIHVTEINSENLAKLELFATKIS